MYSQFGFAEGNKLNDALKALNSKSENNEEYQQALSSALQVLNDSHAVEGKKPEWAIEVISAYREVGKSLLRQVSLNLQFYPKELLSLEKEFGGLLDEYPGERVVEKIGTLLADLSDIDSERLSGDKSQTLTARLGFTLTDFENISGVMNGYNLKDSDELGMALRERQELLEQAEMFERNF